MSPTTQPNSSKPISAKRMEQAIVALLENSSVEKAASAIGISSTTLWRWMQQDAFEEAYLKARRKAVSQSLARLQHASSAAVTALLRILLDTSSAAYSRVRAADCILERAIEALEIEDLEFRLRRLESQQTK
jgi:hypothetical protein